MYSVKTTRVLGAGGDFFFWGGAVAYTYTL